ncbi:hypothetical protein ANCDUO_13682, partial [Ancylostoma duodenale]
MKTRKLCHSFGANEHIAAKGPRGSCRVCGTTGRHTSVCKKFFDLQDTSRSSATIIPTKKQSQPRKWTSRTLTTTAKVNSVVFEPPLDAKPQPDAIQTTADIPGQGVFALLPVFNSGQKWIMMGARLMTGFGAGTLSVLRAYAATASVPRDRLRAVSFGTAGYVLGLSFGPAIQLFTLCVEFTRISTPWSVVMYNWKDSDAVLYNGIFQTASCLVSSGNSFLIGYTRIGQIEKRKQIIFGVTVFLLFHVFNYPWPFYPGPLDYVPEGYRYIMVTQICTLGLALILTIVFYKRLVPLKMKPALGKAAKYKN